VIRVGSFNVHGFVGRDGRRDLPRIAQVINELDCDAIGLQEVDSRGAASSFTELEELTGMHVIPGVTIAAPDGDYGNVLLTTRRAVDVIRHDLTVAGREPRGAIEARLDDAAGMAFIMIVTHLGLRRRERRRQVRDLLRICRHSGSDPMVLVGDFNEWWPMARTLRELHREFGRSRAVVTFPSSRPVFALDRIWARPDVAIDNLRTQDTAITRVASDHLPIIAELTSPGPARIRNGD